MSRVRKWTYSVSRSFGDGKCSVRRAEENAPLQCPAKSARLKNRTNARKERLRIRFVPSEGSCDADGFEENAFFAQFTAQEKKICSRSPFCPSLVLG